MTPLLTRRGTLVVLGGALAAPYVPRARAEEAVLNFYNWADYIGETTIADFEAATGIRVNNDLYASTEEMQAKMLAGMTGYDVVLTAGNDIPRFSAAGILRKLDRSQLPGWKNLDPQVLRIFHGWDPRNDYGTPYMWGSVGFTFNRSLVEERVPGLDMDSLDFLFDRATAEKLADIGISVLDSPQDVIPMTLKYLGMDGDSRNPADYDQVVAAFRPIRDLILTFDNTNFINALPNGEIGIANSWSGDYATALARAAEAGIDIDLAYRVPRTGAPAWADCMTIPSDAPHPGNAYHFLEYLLQPEVIAACTTYTNYANGNAASKPFIDPAILANPAIYPDAETVTRMWAPKPFTDEMDRALARAWTEIRSG